MSRIGASACVVACATVAVVATPSLVAERAGSVVPCGLRLPPPRFGEPPFVVPAGGSFHVRHLAGGAFTCTLLRPVGTRFALAFDDRYGHVLDVQFFRPSGQLLEDEDGAFAVSSSPRPFLVSCGSANRRTIGAHFWRRGLVWRLGRIPAGLNAARVVHALRSAMGEWVNNVNWCRIRNNAHVPVRYAGRTSLAALRDDDQNVVDFGRLSGDEGCGRAIACAQTWYGAGGQPVESDVRFNTAFRWSVGPHRGAFDIQSVAAHEFGHVLQFDHVTNGAKREFTALMWPYISQANITGHKLGRGEAIGDNTYYRAR